MNAAVPHVAVECIQASRPDPYRRLAAAVLLCAWRDRDAVGPVGDSARRFLEGDPGTLAFWCAVAKIHPTALQKRH